MELKPTITVLVNGYEVIFDDEDLPKILDTGSELRVNNHGYVKLSRIATYLHRFVMGAKASDPIVDHIDGNPLNNSKSNLRFVSKQENAWNSAKAYSNSTTGIRGVTWKKSSRSYIARIRVNKVLIHLGHFHKLEDAQAAYLAAKQKYHLIPE